MTRSRRRRRGPSRALALVAVLALVALLCAATACSEQTQTVVAPAATAAPPGYDAALLDRARDVVGGTGDRDGWRSAVVLATVPIPDGPDELLVVTAPRGDTAWLELCADDYSQEAWAELDALVDVGDLIDYDTAGGDDAVCLDEVRLRSKGAALPTATPTPR